MVDTRWNGKPVKATRVIVRLDDGDERRATKVEGAISGDRTLDTFYLDDEPYEGSTFAPEFGQPDYSGAMMVPTRIEELSGWRKVCNGGCGNRAHRELRNVACEIELGLPLSHDKRMASSG